MNNSSTYTCPFCQQPIPMEDINVAKNMSLCRSCGATSAFSDLVNEQKNDEILSNPPKHLKIEKTTQGITLTYKKLHPIAIFFLIFSLFWTGCIWGLMIPSMLKDGDFHILFCIPFVLMDVVVIAMAVVLLFGKSVISVSVGKGTYTCGIGFLSISRKFDLTRETKFEEKIIGHSNGTPIKAMSINNPGMKPITIGHLIAEDAFPYIKAILSQLRS